MKPLPRHKFFAAAARWLCALLAALALPVNGFAQPKSPERWLFVFDLSPAMKKRLPATEEVLKTFFASRAGGRLQEGDNIGVWTYDQKMHAGQFPLAIWNPDQATTLTTNLAAFLRSRPFTKESQLAALQPVLSSVITNSERLTILIFCAGESDMTGTPYDRGINQNFLDSRLERKKNQQPFVVLIRTLSGKFIGCTVNFPPGMINIPRFLAPPPPPATNAPAAALPQPAVVKPAPPAVPDLVIIGTKVNGMTNATAPVVPPATNLPPPLVIQKIAATPIVVPPAATPMVPPVLPPTVTPVVTPIVTHPVLVPAPVMANTNLPATNHVAAPLPVNPPTATVITPTNIPGGNVSTNASSSPEKPTRHLILAGGGVLVVAIVLLVLILRPGRRSETSLISSSMQDDSRRN